ncbi:MAG TPA: ABC transporter permease [Trueperaceae bacterium]|nr:ABC transporter permease [Trueperaceae bacterium]
MDRSQGVLAARLAAVDWRGLGVWLAVIALALVALAMSPGFLSPRSLLNVLRQAAPLGIVATGITLVMVARRVDLSVGATASLAAVVAAALMRGSDERIVLAIGAALTVGALVGLVNGFLVARARLEPFVTTLGVAILLNGLNRTLTGGTAYGVLAPGFRRTLNAWWGGVPAAVVLLAAVVAVCAFLLHRTRFGRTLYLTGSNEEAARLSGVPVVRSLTLAYVTSGTIGAFAGIVLLARYGISGNLIGEGYEFDALAAAVLGGATFEGGKGTVWGTIGGVLLLSLAYTLVLLGGLSYHWQLVVRGGIIIGAVTLYALTRSRR